MTTGPVSVSPASRRAFLQAAGLGLLALPTQAAAQSAGIQAASGAIVPQQFGAAGDGSRDDAAAVQAMIDEALNADKPIFFPPGVYRIGKPIMIRIGRYLAHKDAFGAGPRISGAGSGRTIFETSSNRGFLFDLDTKADHSAEFRAVLGSLFEGFTIRGGGGGGIKLRTAFNTTIRDIHIVGLRGTGIKVECLLGDLDGSNMIALEQVRIEDCSGWGVDAASAPGHNEISFLRLQHVFIQGCGSPDSSYVPRSGGMRWKGQIAGLDQCAFTINSNVGLFIPGEAGLGQTMDIQNTAFENNHRRHLFCTGISNFRGRNIQFYSNDNHLARVACEFDGQRYTVRGVDLDGSVVRATPGNRDFTAFKIGGVHAELDNCRVRNVIWDNFGHPGQIRFEGWKPV